MYHAGSKVNEKWAIIPLCWLVHRGGMLDKRINEWLALNRATDEDLGKYRSSEDGWKKRKKWLNRAMGEADFGSRGHAPF